MGWPEMPRELVGENAHNVFAHIWLERRPVAVVCDEDSVERAMVHPELNPAANEDEPWKHSEALLGTPRCCRLKCV